MERIIVNSKILGGKPIIKGTRISVEHILNLLASDVTEKEILEDFSHLSKDDIHACLKYAAELEKRMAMPSHLQKILFANMGLEQRVQLIQQ